MHRTTTNRLFIAGSSSAVPRPGRANSGYLLRTSEAAIALELGSGALSSLRTALDLRDLSSVLISHMHADHFIDLIALRHALTMEIRRAEPVPGTCLRAARRF